MKKLLALVIVLAALGVGGFFLWQKYFQGNYSEQVFPAETVAYVYFHDVREAAQNLPKTTLWQQLAKSPRLKLYDKQLDSFFYLIESSTGIDIRPLLKQFQRDLAFGLFPLANHKVGVAFVAYVENESETDQFFERRTDANLKRRIPDLQKFGLNYGGVLYYRYNSSRLPDGLTPSYAIIKHHLVIASSEDGLKKLIDVKKGGAIALKKSEVFQSAKKQIAYQRGLLTYVDAQKALAMIHDSLSPARQKYWPTVIKITGLYGLQSFIYNVSVANQGFEETGFLSVKPQREGLLKIYFEQQPQKLHGADTIPAESKVMNAGTLADFAKMWDEVSSQLNTILTPTQYERWQKVLNAMRGIFNFDVRRDVLEPLGNEFCFSYQAPRGDISDPMQLKYLLVLQLRNPQKFRETLDRAVSLASLRGVQQKQENYQGKKIQSFDVQLAQLSARPAYYLENSWFYFSTDVALLKSAIDAQAQKKGIQSLADYQKVTTGFPEEVNGLSYTNVNAYLQMYAAVLNRQANEERNQWIRQYGVQEELASLGKSLFGAASYTVIQKDGMYIHSYASVPTSFLALPAVATAVPQVLKTYSERQSQ